MKRKNHPKNRPLSQILYTFSLVFLLLGLFLLAWTVWPVPIDVVQMRIPAGPLPASPPGAEFANLSDYDLRISWPRWVRQGETGQIHLDLTDTYLTTQPAGDTQSVQIILIEPTIVKVSQEYPGNTDGLYESNYPLLITPPGSLQANLGDDQDLYLTWQVNGIRRGNYTGKMFVSFGFFYDEAEPAPTNDPSQEKIIAVPVAVVDFQIRGIQLWGMQPGLVTWFGLLCLVLWGALFILGRVIAER